MDNLTNFMHGPAGIVVGLLMLLMLATREVARDARGPSWQALAQGLTLALTPIVVIFLATVAALLIQAFR